jgi:hypothetical protein
MEQLLEAIDKLDVQAVMAQLAPDPRILVVDGRRADGTKAARELFTEFLGALRNTAHRITAQWHVDDVWIAEVEASYELQDYLKLNALPRAFILRIGAEGIAELRAYGAHEQPLTDHRTGEEGMWIGTRWIPPL